MGKQFSMSDETACEPGNGGEPLSGGDGAVWQPQLLSAPRQDRSRTPALALGEIYRQRGLAGVAEARAALAEAARRVEARHLHEAA